ncbi:hypothetical protein CONLIGDRAFT_690165, partial [Coniochaeta ligniaria NRRL 30616]
EELSTALKNPDISSSYTSPNTHLNPLTTNRFKNATTRPNNPAHSRHPLHPRGLHPLLPAIRNLRLHLRADKRTTLWLAALTTPNTTYTENDLHLPLEHGILSQAIGISHAFSIHDPVSCSNFTELTSPRIRTRTSSPRGWCSIAWGQRLRWRRVSLVMRETGRLTPHGTKGETWGVIPGGERILGR